MVRGVVLRINLLVSFSLDAPNRMICGILY